MRFLLSGYYGCGNLGDEALLATIVAELRTRYPLAEIDVLSATPEETAHAYGVEATPRGEAGAVRAAIDRADVVLSGGGGLLQNATSLRSLLYYAGIIRSAVRAGKPTMVFAQSVGPLDFWGKKTVRELCRGLAAATVRDERSRALFAPLVPDVVVERTADPVFLYDPPAEREPAAPNDAPVVVVCVRKTAHQNELVERIAFAVDYLAERYGARSLFVPFAGPSDADVATTIIRKCASKPMLVPPGSLDDTAATIASADFVVGVRLHALVLAARCGVPFVAIPYDPKVNGLCEDLEYPLTPLWTPGDRAIAIERDQRRLLDDAWSQRDALAAALRARLPAMRSLAAANFDVLGRIVR